jgi:hypothetical protein
VDFLSGFFFSRQNPLFVRFFGGKLFFAIS